MLPFGYACEGLERVVRDAAKATGKRVHLDIVGVDVGVDRARSSGCVTRSCNSCGTRSTTGSNRRTNVFASVSRRKARSGFGTPEVPNFEVTVSDDGRGLDLEHLRRRVRDAASISTKRSRSRRLSTGRVDRCKRHETLGTRRRPRRRAQRDRGDARNVEVTSKPQIGTTFTLTFR